MFLKQSAVNKSVRQLPQLVFCYLGVLFIAIPGCVVLPHLVAISSIVQAGVNCCYYVSHSDCSSSTTVTISCTLVPGMLVVLADGMVLFLYTMV